MIFYAIFDADCQPNMILVSEPKIDELTPVSQVNFFRGILNQLGAEVILFNRQNRFYALLNLVVSTINHPMTITEYLISFYFRNS